MRSRGATSRAVTQSASASESVLGFKHLIQRLRDPLPPLRPCSSNVFDEMRRMGFSPVASRVCGARVAGIHELDHYLNPELMRHPDGREVGGYKKLKEFLGKARGEGGVLIAYDFDVDGATSASLWALCCKALGVPFEFITPDRLRDGYGYKPWMAESAIKKGIKNILCLDFGSQSEEQFKEGRSKGVEFGVIDHHPVTLSPNSADVFINPHVCGYLRGIRCTAGLSFDLVKALCEDEEQWNSETELRAIALATLGTVADVVPLVGANRALVARGLVALDTPGALPGFEAIRDAQEQKGPTTSRGIAFGAAPALNAAGRVSPKGAALALEVLTSAPQGDFHREGILKALAKELVGENHARRLKETEALQKARDIILEGNLQESAGIVVAHESFHLGVVGIVAQRIVDWLGVPVLVLGLGGVDTWKGSMRSPAGINGLSLLESCYREGALATFGGHKRAGGVSLAMDLLPHLTRAFDDAARTEGPVKSAAWADVEATPSELTPEVLKELMLGEPFGEANPPPRLILRNVLVERKAPSGAMHTKGALTGPDGASIDFFVRNIPDPSQVALEGKLDVLVEVTSRWWEGKTLYTIELVRAVPADTNERSGGEGPSSSNYVDV